MLHSRASNSVGPTVNSWLHRYRNLNILAKKAMPHTLLDFTRIKLILSIWS